MPDMQTAIALLLVAAAGAFLIRRMLQTVRGGSGCGTGSCGSCPSNQQGGEAGETIVTLEVPQARRGRGAS